MQRLPDPELLHPVCRVSDGERAGRHEYQVKQTTTAQQTQPNNGTAILLISYLLLCVTIQTRQSLFCLIFFFKLYLCVLSISV